MWGWRRPTTFAIGYASQPTHNLEGSHSGFGGGSRPTLGGELTSRPKALVHVTLGRLLGAPAGVRVSPRCRGLSPAADGE